jgi:hypothetical protein
MRGKERLLVLLLLAVAAPASSSASTARSGPPAPAQPAALLVELGHAPAGATLDSLRDAGAALIERDLRIWRLPSGAASRLVAVLSRAGLARGSEVDRTLGTLTADQTTSARPSSQWWLRAMGADGVTPPGPGKPVTIVDTGADVGIPEFGGKHVTLLNRQLGIDLPGDFHGTAVTSLIAASPGSMPRRKPGPE